MCSYVSCLEVEILQNRQQNRHRIDKISVGGVRRQNRQNICVGISLKNKRNLNVYFVKFRPPGMRRMNTLYE